MYQIPLPAGKFQPTPEGRRRSAAQPTEEFHRTYSAAGKPSRKNSRSAAGAHPPPAEKNRDQPLGHPAQPERGSERPAPAGQSAARGRNRPPTVARSSTQKCCLVHCAARAVRTRHSVCTICRAGVMSGTTRASHPRARHRPPGELLRPLPVWRSLTGMLNDVPQCTSRSQPSGVSFGARTIAPSPELTQIYAGQFSARGLRVRPQAVAPMGALHHDPASRRSYSRWFGTRKPQPSRLAVPKPERQCDGHAVADSLIDASSSAERRGQRRSRSSSRPRSGLRLLVLGPGTAARSRSSAACWSRRPARI